MSELMMRLAALSNNASAFETGVENLVQGMFGYLGRWDTICGDWDTYQAMELWLKNKEEFYNRLADYMLPLINRPPK